ncbi:MAG: hypothetical protein II929_05995 [Succinivibrio sp.]|nr:hypothetical protein [Succinivibrio sp.]
MKSSQAYYGYELKKKSFAQYQNEQIKQQKKQKERIHSDWTLSFLQLTGAALSIPAVLSMLAFALPFLLFLGIVVYALAISAF